MSAIYRYLTLFTLFYLNVYCVEGIKPFNKTAHHEEHCNVGIVNLEDCTCEGNEISFQQNTSNIIDKSETIVDDCACEMSDVDGVNDMLLPILQKLVDTTYFRYYKLNLWRPCTFFPEDGLCALKTCAVDECEEQEFLDACGNDPEITKLDTKVDTSKFDLWKECGGDHWTNDADPMNAADEMNYFDLQKNPEKFTGYNGETAHRIWKAIYGENCFLEDYRFESDPIGFHDVCVEKRVFYRLISGLHTSISTHIAYDYLLNSDLNLWGPNHQLFYYTVGKYPARLKNLYFTYLFLLRSVTKILPGLQEYNFPSKMESESILIKDIMKDIGNILETCTTFDETGMFHGEGAPLLKRQFKEHFRNISAILDCVSCEKCKLWGKLQINGLGTSLKILFEYDEANDVSQIGLERTEIIALFNTLKRLAESIKWSKEMMNYVVEEVASVENTTPPENNIADMFK